MTRKHRRKKGSLFTKMIGATALVALLCFCVFSVTEYLKKKDTESNEAQEANLVENTNTAEYTVEPTNSNNNTASSESKTEDLSDIKEAAAAAEQKPEVAKNENGLKIAEPKVTYAGIGGDGRLVISGEISNILDQEGTCSFVIQNGEKSAVIDQGILPNAKNSVCDAINFEKNSEQLTNIKKTLGTGEWSVKIKYKSNYAEGESETTKFLVN